MTSRDEHPNWDRMDELFRSDSYARELGITLEDWGGGWSRVHYVPVEEHHNFGGIAHGGSIFSVGDVAFSVASNSWGRRAVALTVDAHFLSAPEVGTPLVAEGKERSRTRRTASYQIEISDARGPVGSLHAMVYRLGAWFFGEEAWPEQWVRDH
ncbi:MAG: hotdog fold thioesterase [Nitriliruptorales bacterium]|nr:hotdog fold thioesterase [Nitriliruptorales bacterium]